MKQGNKGEPAIGQGKKVLASGRGVIGPGEAVSVYSEAKTPHMYHATELTISISYRPR